MTLGGPLSSRGHFDEKTLHASLADDGREEVNASLTHQLCNAMKRRDFLVQAGISSLVLPAAARAAVLPCPPEVLQVAGGQSVTTACGPIGPIPAWMPSTMYQWRTIAADGTRSSVTPYSGMAWDDVNKKIYMFGGGHGGLYDNSLYVCDLNVALPAWAVSIPQSSDKTYPTKEYGSAPYYSDGKPHARHTYYTFHYTNGKVWSLMCRFAIGNGDGQLTTNDVDSAIPGGNWAAPGTHPDCPNGGSDYESPSFVDRYGVCWHHPARSMQLLSFTAPASGAGEWTNHGVVAPSGYPYSDLPFRSACYDSVNHRYISMANTSSASNEGSGYTTPFWVDLATKAVTTFSLSGAAAGDVLTDAVCAFDPVAVCIWVRKTNATTLYKISNLYGTWSVSIVPTTGVPPPVTASSERELWSRWRYLPSLGGIVAWPSSTSSLYFLRLH